MPILNMGGGGGGVTLITAPTVTVGTYTYDGTAQGPTITYASGTSDKITATNATATNVGSYTLTLSLVNVNKYVWSDGTTADKTYTYTIDQRTVTLTAPTVNSSTLTYDGTAQTLTGSAGSCTTGGTMYYYTADYTTSTAPAFSTTSGDWSTTFPTATGTNAGTYNLWYYAYVSDTSNNTGAGINSATAVTKTIGQATPTITKSASSVSLDTTTTYQDVTITTDGDGALTVSSSDTSIATVANVSGSTYRITGVATGSATINIAAAAGSNYTSASDTISVDCSMLNIVSWSSGSDSDVAAMIDAAQAGTIDLQTDGGWAVGDVRTITVSSFTDGASTTHASQSIDLVITSFDDYNSCGAVMQFDFKDQLATGVRMNSSNTNAGGYGSSEMYTTTLPALVNALPSWLSSRLLTFSVLASAGSASSTINTVTNNKLALRSEVEIFGSTTYSVSGEGSQVSYYATSANRVKTRGHGGSASRWWERSPDSSISTYFCRVYSDGSAGVNYASYTIGVAPFGCL